MRVCIFGSNFILKAKIDDYNYMLLFTNDNDDDELMTIIYITNKIIL